MPDHDVIDECFAADPCAGYPFLGRRAGGR